MIRYRLRTLLILAALGPPALWWAWSASDVPTKEPPQTWKLAEVAGAAPPRSDGGPTHVLAWKIVEDDRPHRVEYCLVLKQLQQPTEKQERWVLASLARVPADKDEWDFVTIWVSPGPDFKNPPLFMHVERYRERPTNADIYAFMDRCDWRLGADSDFFLGIDGTVCHSHLIDGGICKAWKKVIGEKPLRAFTKASPPERP